MASSAQDYRAVANILNTSKLTYGGDVSPADSVIEDIAVALADHFEADNPRFDRQRFMTAAGFPYTSDPWEDQR